MEPLRKALETFAQPLTPYAPGSGEFWGVVAAAAGVLLVFGWLVHHFLFAGRRGFLVVFVANFLALAAGVAAAAAVQGYADLHILPKDWTWVAPAAAGVVAWLLMAVFVVRFLLGQGALGSLGTLGLSLICLVVIGWLGRSLLQNVGGSLSTIEKKEKSKVNEVMP